VQPSQQKYQGSKVPNKTPTILSNPANESNQKKEKEEFPIEFAGVYLAPFI